MRSLVNWQRKARALYGPKAYQKDLPTVLRDERNIFQEHSRRWRELREGHRQTRDFAVGLNLWRTRRLLGPGLERNTVRLVVGLLTGHDTLQRYLYSHRCCERYRKSAESVAWWRNPRSMSYVSADTITGITQRLLGQVNPDSANIRH